MADSGRLLDALRSAVGPSHCLTDSDLRASYETDWTRRYTGHALAVARPGSTSQVAAVLRACADSGVGVVPQGGNTGLVGGSVPRGGEVVLSLLRLRDLDPVDRLAGEVTVGAGATLASVQAHARRAGWELGVDLAARDSATIGGMVATNAGGEHVLRYGPIRQQLLGLQAVLADGSVVRRHGPYDLPGLLCGSEGTLAVITRVRLRLVAGLPRRAVAVVGLASAEALVEAAAALRRSVPSLLALEFFTHAGLDLVRRHAGLAPPFTTAHPTYLLAEAATAAGDPTDGLARAVDALGVGDAVVATDVAGRHRLWELRERHTEAINAEGVPHKVDVSVPIARYAELVARAPQVVEAVAPGARTILFGHIGEGSLHVSVLGPAPEDEAADDAVLDLVVDLGGSISAEHGIGVAKARWLERSLSDADLAAMWRIKDGLDPRQILNPGVILPIHRGHPVSDEELIGRYVDAVISHGRATEAGDYEEANRLHDVIAGSYREARRRGGRAERRLIELLQHPNAFVRAWSGALCLELAPADAERALRALAAEDRGPAGFAARMTLSEWSAGRLRFP